MVYQLNKAEFVVLLRHGWLQLLKQPLATAPPLPYYNCNKSAHSLMFTFWLILAFKEGLRSPESASLLSLCLILFGKIPTHNIIFEMTARPSIKWFRFTCIDTLESIFQICTFFKFTVYVFKIFLKFQTVFFCWRCRFLWKGLMVFFILYFKTFYHTGTGIKWRFRFP